MLEVGHFKTHQVVEAPSLHHVLHLLGEGSNLWVSLLLTYVIEQVVEDVANHLDLLLTLQVIVNLSSSLISHELLPSVSLHPLEVTQDVCDASAKFVEILIEVLLLLWIKRLLLSVRVARGETLVGCGWLRPVLPCIDGLAAVHIVHLAVWGEGSIVATISSLIALRVRIAVSAILSITVPTSAILSTVARWFTS